MPSVERSITVDQPPTKVWAYMSDFTNTEDWDPPTIRTERTSGDGGVGTTYHNVSKILGREKEIEYTVLEYVDLARLQLSGDAGSVTMLDTITLEPTGAGTTLTYHLDVSTRGTVRLAEPLVPAALKILADRVAASLEDKLRNLP
jgi:carbon monoxide dehydrogenase subunit G